MEIGTKRLNLDSVRKRRDCLSPAAQSPQFDRFSQIRYLPKDTCEKAHAPVHGTVYLRRHGGERAQNTSSAIWSVISTWEPCPFTRQRSTSQFLDQTDPDVNTPEEEIHRHTQALYNPRIFHQINHRTFKCHMSESPVPMIPGFSTSPSFEWADPRNAIKTNYSLE